MPTPRDDDNERMDETEHADLRYGDENLNDPDFDDDIDEDIDDDAEWDYTDTDAPYVQR